MRQFAPLTGFLILLLYIKIIESSVVTQFKGHYNIRRLWMIQKLRRDKMEFQPSKELT